MYDYYKSLPGYLSMVANISLVSALISLFFNWRVSVPLFALTVVLWFSSLALHKKAVFKDLLEAGHEDSKVRYRGSNVIQRELAGVQLCTFAGAFEVHPGWQEMEEEKRSMFGPGFPEERIFDKISGDKLIVCGCIFDKVYKIGIQAPLSYTDFYLSQFTGEYGQAARNRQGWYEWEDDNTCLQVTTGFEESLLAVFLTDKELLMEGWEKLRHKHKEEKR